MTTPTDANNLIQTDFNLWDENSTSPLSLTYTFLDTYPVYYGLEPGNIYISKEFDIDPLTIIVFIVLALPLTGAAALGALIARKLPRGGG